MTKYTIEDLKEIDVFSLPWDDLKNIYDKKRGREYLQSKDQLNFFKQADDFLKDIKGMDVETSSKLNLVKGLWGAGKTTFTKILLLRLYDAAKKKGKAFIPIIFNPWYIDKKNIDESFFNLLADSLLQYKWNKDLKDSVNSLLSIMDSLDNTWTKILSTCMKIFSSEEQTIDNKINRIASIINKNYEYKDVEIVIRIDEIDRLDQIKLMELGQLLDIIKKITELCKGNQCLSVFSWNPKYLSNIILPGGQGESTFELYFSRFKFLIIDIYEKNKILFRKLIINNFYNITGIGNKESDILLESKYSKVLQIFYEKNIPLVMRNIRSLFYNLENSIIRYKEKKVIEEIDISDIITEDIRFAYLYFGQIYVEKTSLYPSYLTDDSLIYYRIREDGYYLEEFQKDHKGFSEVQKLNDKEFDRWISDTFVYVDGLINKNFEVFLNKEVAELDKEIVAKINDSDNNDPFLLIKKYSKLYLDGNPDTQLDKLFYKLSAEIYRVSGRSEDKNKLFDSIIQLSKNIFENYDSLCSVNSDYQNFMNNLRSITYGLILCMNQYNSEDFKLESFQTSLDTINSFPPLIKVYIYRVFLLYSLNSRNEYKNFEGICKEVLDKTVDTENYTLKDISFSLGSYKKGSTFFRSKVLESLNDLMGNSLFFDEAIDQAIKLLDMNNNSRDKVIQLIDFILHCFDDTISENGMRKLFTLVSNKTKRQLLCYCVWLNDPRVNGLNWTEYSYSKKELKEIYLSLKDDKNFINSTDIYVRKSIGYESRLENGNEDKDIVIKWFEKQFELDE